MKVDMQSLHLVGFGAIQKVNEKANGLNLVEQLQITFKLVCA
ncbi:hypothetical protein GPEL0_01r2398 [Geoanaerobacter pelophilus]|uniref:Uncharacterized protein n=1 Tax=Geoanaerobacter pelophilus TaxID=60036 RepID=A0ABQ0MKY6_9BACT|nr:hypothetical protein GPEL0_01r2398 [Geoanaerobacter pelophilus]